MPFPRTFVFIHQAQRRQSTTLKAHERLKGIGREKGRLKNTVNRRSKDINQSQRER